MKLTFNEHSERIHEVFEEENKYMTFSKLCVDTVKLYLRNSKKLLV